MKPCVGLVATSLRRRCLSRRERGQTLVEYGLILALITLAVVALLSAIGGDVLTLFTSIQGQVQNAATP